MVLEADSTLCMVSFLQLMLLKWQLSQLFRIREKLVLLNYGPGSVVSIATGYGLDGPKIESRWGRDFPPVQTGPETHPASFKMGTGSFPWVKCGRGVTLTCHPLLVPW